MRYKWYAYYHDFILVCKLSDRNIDKQLLLESTSSNFAFNYYVLHVIEEQWHRTNIMQRYG